MTKRKYEKLSPADAQIVDDIFILASDHVKAMGIKPRFDDHAEYFVNAITEYVLKCREPRNEQT